MTIPLGRLFIVTYPVLTTEVGGVLITEGGERLGAEQSSSASEVVDRLAKLVDQADIDRGLVLVVPGWEKAPEGLRERYDARRRAEGPTRTLTRVDEDEIAAARAKLSLQ